MRRFYLLLTGLIVIAIAVVVLTRLKATPTRSQGQSAASQQPQSDLAAKLAQLPEAKRPKIVALGDSITAGYGVDSAEAYPKQLERLLNESGYPHMVYNGGVNGADTARVFPRLDGWLEKKPVLVIVELGLNDRVPPEETKENLTEIIRRFQTIGAKVVLSGQERPDSRQLYEDLAEELKIPLISDMRHGLDQVQGYQKDGVHCNPKGCLYMVEHNVLPVILPLLSKELQ